MENELNKQQEDFLLEQSRERDYEKRCPHLLKDDPVHAICEDCWIKLHKIKPELIQKIQ